MSNLRFWTYIITNQRSGALYIGHTDDIYLRVEQHIRGTYEGFSKKYGLKHLVWFAEFQRRHEAFKEERRLKNWRRQWKLELIEQYNPNWIDIHKAKYWPLPDKTLFPEHYEDCLKHSLKLVVRQEERRFLDGDVLYD